MIRTYRELTFYKTLEERFDYLKLGGTVGFQTFGHERYLNQRFYTSREWKQIRHHVIARDNGNDMGIDGMPVHDKIIIHHMNPMTPDDIISQRKDILDPEFLIMVSFNTHNAIHYGDRSLLPKPFTERQRGDTKLW